MYARRCSGKMVSVLDVFGACDFAVGPLYRSTFFYVGNLYWWVTHDHASEYAPTVGRWWPNVKGLRRWEFLSLHHASKETKIRPIGCMLCKVNTVSSLSWFYLSFGCIFRTVLEMTIWQNVLFLIQSDPPTTHGALRGGPWIGTSTITLKF